MSESLRILWVASQLERDWSGGIGRVVAGGLAALAARGHEVHLAGRARDGEPAPVPGATLHPWPEARRSQAAPLPLLCALQRRLRAHVVHFHSAQPHGKLIVPFLVLRGLLGRPAVVVSPYTGSRANYPKWGVRTALARADAVVVSSRWTAERAVAAGASPARVAVIPPGADLPLAAGEAKRSPLVVVLTRLVASKGIDVLLDAFDAAAAARPQWRLHVAGDGPEAESLRRRAAQLRAADRVEFLGLVRGDTKRALLAEAAIGVQPSRDDNFPGALLELQAHGVPCIGSAVGGIPDLLADGAAGVLVPPGDAGALASALGALMDDAERRAALAAASRGVAAERTFERFAERLEALYREMA